MAAEKIDRIDKYQILEQIGIGGMGAVYKALHPQFKKYVAVKEIRSDLADNPDLQRRFEREAELLAQLPPHPNIVTVRDALVWRGQLYLVMDYIEGETLGEVAKRGSVEPSRGAAILEQILSGLDAIHRRGIVHRDLKAGNILIDLEGTVYISDFGIAKSIARPDQTKVMATPRGAAPELIDPSLGRSGAEQQIDIYAAGMLAYEMLLGENRFRAAFLDVYNGQPGSEAERWLSWHTNLARDAPSLSEIDPGIPRPLGRIVERMMAKNVKERYEDASQARRDLAVWMWGSEESRGRRGDSPRDDATVPLDRIRSGSDRAGGSSRNRTTPLQPRMTGEKRVYDDSQQNRQPDSAPVPPPSPNRFSKTHLRWTAAAALPVLLLIVSFVLISAIGEQPGFTLIVHGAPRGSLVYVGNKRVGIPTVEDTIRVFGLRTSESLPIQVVYDGSECVLDKKSATGKDGDLEHVTAQCNSVSLPEEIDYGGQMVLVRDEGEFPMGDDAHMDDEKPRHQVKIASYYIDKYEVTNEQYRRFCKETGRPEPTEYVLIKQFYENNPKYPVIGISWDDAVAYADWLKKRLPTEAEWEKASSWDPKARRKYQFPWGDNPDMTKARLAKDAPGSTLEYETDVSAYRVRGMGGNASEWVSNLFDRYTNDSPSNSDFKNGHRVVRGGSFFLKDIGEARTTFRAHWPHDEKAGVKHGTSIGFRCAISADDLALMQYLRQRSLPK